MFSVPLCLYILQCLTEKMGNIMKQYQIPNTELKVSALCFGGGSFGTSIKGKGADLLVSAFVEAGGCYFDTAHCYRVQHTTFPNVYMTLYY